MKDIRICFIGESYVNGTGDSKHLGWAGRLCTELSQKAYSVTYYNLGIRSETSTELLHRWQAETQRRLPKNTNNYVVFSFGTNDTSIKNGKRRVELVDSIKNTKQILDTARQTNSVLMISPPPTSDSEQNSRTQNLCQHFQRICQELNIPFNN